jgi:hypothetical protein
VIRSITNVGGNHQSSYVVRPVHARTSRE